MNWTKLTKGTKVRCKRSGKVGYFMFYRGFVAQMSMVNADSLMVEYIWCSAGCDLEVVS